MPDIKLLRIEKGDNQKNLADKLNYNFSRIVTFGGGPYGKIGQEGPQGDPGYTGPTGSYGDQGQRGSIWTVGPTQPSLSSSLSGDFWMNSGSNNAIYQFLSGGWAPYGFSVFSQSIFRVKAGVNTTSGITNYKGYYLTPSNSIDYTLNLSDNTLANGSSTANPQYSKMTISIDGGVTGKGILEFTKGDYNGNKSFSSKTPRFFWSDRSSAYNLSFHNGDSNLFDLPSNKLNLSVGSSIENPLSLRGTGFNLNLRSTSKQLNIISNSGNIVFNINSGYANFMTTNISYSSGIFYVPVKLSFSSSLSKPAPPLTIKTNSYNSNGLGYLALLPLYNDSLNQSWSDGGPRLLRAMDISSGNKIIDVLGNGTFYYNKKIDSFQGAQSVTTIGTSTVTPSAGPIETVSWFPVVPSVVMPSGVNTSNYSNGLDVVISPSVSGPSSTSGVYLWTPATGPNTGENYGWLSLLDRYEAITVRVRTDDESKFFRYVAIGSGQTYNVFPYDSYTGGEWWDLTGNDTIGASNIEFTIVNVVQSDTGGRNGTDRWFQIFFSAYGGNLPNSVCGVLVTNNSSY